MLDYWESGLSQLCDPDSVLVSLTVAPEAQTKDQMKQIPCRSCFKEQHRLKPEERVCLWLHKTSSVKPASDDLGQKQGQMRKTQETRVTNTRKLTAEAWMSAGGNE